MEDLSKALPIIVSNYAKRFGVKVRMQGTNAYTNGKVITIPRLNLNHNKTARKAYAFLAHEAAHVRYTDFSVVVKAHENFLLFALFNILEDARVESVIGREFIGVYENLELLRSGFYDEWREFIRTMVERTEIHIFCAFLSYYIPCYCQQFISLRRRAAIMYWHLKRRMPGRVISYNVRLALNILYAKNSKDVNKIAEAIFQNIKQYVVERDKRKEEPHNDFFLRLKNEVLEKKPDARYQRQVNKFESDCTEKMTGLTPHSCGSHIIDCLKNDETSARDDLGLLDVGQCTNGREDFLGLIENTYKIRHGLAQKVKTYVDMRGAHSITGKKINAIRASLIPIGETDIFFNVLEEEDYSTSIHILTDVSGSMLSTDGNPRTRCEEACLSALTLAVALEGIDGIKTMATFFPGVNSEFSIALNETERASVHAPRFDQGARGSTPLAQALWFALGKVINLECNRNIIVVLTDGIPDSVAQAKLALNLAKERGVEVYGIGIRLEYIKSLFENSYVIQNAHELTNAVFKLFHSLFKVPQTS